MADTREMEDMTFEELIERYNEWAAKHGKPPHFLTRWTFEPVHYTGIMTVTRAETPRAPGDEMTLATLDELITEAETSSTPRIYVACLASYNSGVLHGTWIDATDADDMREAIAAMLRQSPYPNVLVDCPGCNGDCHCVNNLSGRVCGVCGAVNPADTPHDKEAHGKVPSAEEYAIHDYDGFGGLSSQLGEYPDLETVAMHARMIDLHGEAWFAYCDWQDTAYQSEDDFEEKFQGEYDSPADYAEQLMEDCYDLRDVPDIIKYHIDYDGIANDMRLGGDNYFAERGGVTYVFDAH